MTFFYRVLIYSLWRVILYLWESIILPFSVLFSWHYTLPGLFNVRYYDLFFLLSHCLLMTCSFFSSEAYYQNWCWLIVCKIQYYFIRNTSIFWTFFFNVIIQKNVKKTFSLNDSDERQRLWVILHHLTEWLPVLCVLSWSRAIQRRWWRSTLPASTSCQSLTSCWMTLGNQTSGLALRSALSVS